MPEGHVLRRFVLSTPLCLPRLVPSPDSSSPFPPYLSLRHSLSFILFLSFFLSRRTCCPSSLDLYVLLSRSFVLSPLLFSPSASSLQIYNALACNKRLRASFTIMSSFQVPRGLIELRPFRSAGLRRQVCQRCLKLGRLRDDYREVRNFDLLMRFVFYALEESRTYKRRAASGARK